jgi:hypothetical protein
LKGHLGCDALIDDSTCRLMGSKDSQWMEIKDRDEALLYEAGQSLES